MSLWSGGLASFYDGADMIENTSIKELKGIGEKTKSILLRQYKSVNRIKNAEEKELIELIGSAKAKIIKEQLKGE